MKQKDLILYLRFYDAQDTAEILRELNKLKSKGLFPPYDVCKSFVDARSTVWGSVISENGAEPTKQILGNSVINQYACPQCHVVWSKPAVEDNDGFEKNYFVERGSDICQKCKVQGAILKSSKA